MLISLILMTEPQLSQRIMVVISNIIHLGLIVVQYQVNVFIYLFIQCTEDLYFGRC